jgi:hypothetical protein
MTRFGGVAAAAAGEAKVSRKGRATRPPAADRRKERRVEELVKNWLTGLLITTLLCLL